MIQYSGLEMDEVHVKHRRPKRTEDLRFKQNIRTTKITIYQNTKNVSHLLLQN